MSWRSFNIVKSLFEITIGDNGLRMYAWAKHRQQARYLALGQIAGTKLAKHPLKVRQLFEDKDEPFCTKPTGDGWPDED
jgi:hypothetical protein